VIATCDAARSDPYCYSSLAQHERLNGRFDRIPVLLDSAEVVVRRTGLKSYQCAYCVIEKAWRLLHEGSTRAAVDMALTLEESPQWNKSELFHQEFHQILDTAYLVLGDHQRAYEHHAKFEALLRRRELTTASSNLANIESRAREELFAAERRTEKLMEAARLYDAELMRNGFMGGFLFVALFALVFLLQRNRINTERERSEALLLNILPEEVAEELKANGSAEAVSIDQVTVLFTDFKGFTALSEVVTPRDLVRDLHECLSAFDAICTKYGIEKIKTIGDAYMAAGGLPTPNTTHATDVTQAAFEMRDFISEGKARKIAAGLPYFEIRIGIHTGPVVAGIVGVKKFQYDIWGDTVNTASRMESSGEVGQVNISESTYELVKNEAGLSFTSRGKVQAKGKGEMEMYFVSSNNGIRT
jgi:class 3 adenylate cyclase